jgi:hypothetical protein
MHPKYILFVLVFLCCSVAHGKSTIIVGGTVFVLANSESAENGKLREFLPRNDHFEHWTYLVAIREFPQIADPKRYIIGFSEQYHAKFPLMKYQLATDNANGDWTIDFMEYPAAGDLHYLEWNFFRAHKRPNGIVVYQYAERFYFTTDAKPAGKAFAETRNKMLGTVWAAKFEEVEEPNQSKDPTP